MAVYLTKEFVNDLKESRDARFVSKVLSRTLGDDGNFESDREDHRYDGIEGGWIRYVTKGVTAYRVIFIRKGTDIYLYRAGGHSIEDDLNPPKSLSGSTEVRSPTFEIARHSITDMDFGSLYKTSEVKYINRHIESLYHVRHKEIMLVSPFVDLEILGSRHKFGRFLDRAVEEGTIIGLFTSMNQTEDRLEAFKKIEERGMSVFFVSGLHTKLYLFEVDLESRNRWQLGIKSQAIIGSSNLTNAGLGLDDATTNEELNYCVPSQVFRETREYIDKLMVLGDDYRKFEFKMMKRRRIQ